MRLNYSALLAGVALAGGLLAAGNLSAQGTKAICPVQKVEVAVTDATKTVNVKGQQVAFCCANCPKAFAANPEKYVSAAGNCPVNKGAAAKATPASRLVVNNDLYYFCCGNCPKAFAADLSKSVKETKDPVTGKRFLVTAASPRAEVDGQLYVFENADSKAKFDADKSKYVVAYGK
jgi:YHS domain-containing protein